jgi:branched-chain amino acid transport system permease protein
VIDPIFLAEAAINGIMLGGILAILALGLNLIFGVIDIVWIVYADLVMLCMYAIYFLYQVHGWPFWVAGLVSLGVGALLGIAVHVLVISPILSSPPINQLLATGGLLFFLQSFATFLWTTDHRSVRFSLPSFEVGGIFLPATRLIPFVISILAMLGLYLFLTRTYMGTAIRAVAQDRDAMALMGANPQRVYVVTSAVGGMMAGLAGALLVFQYSVHPFFGGQFGPLTFMICVLGGVIWSTEMGYVIAFVVFIVMMFLRPGGILVKRE